MPFQAIETQRLYEHVADQIGGLIASGEFKAGDRLPPERDLARKLGVSRPVLREAMVALEVAGLVEVRMGAGTYVKAVARPPVHVGDIGSSPFDVLVARRMVEGEVAALAATRATRDDVDDLRRLNILLGDEIAAGRSEMGPDHAFHLRLARITANSVLIGIVDHLWHVWGSVREPIISRFHEMTNRPDKHRVTILDHEAIVAAIGHGDSEAARQAMAMHIGHVEALFLQDATETASLAGV